MPGMIEGMELSNTQLLLARLAIDLIAALVLVIGIYYRRHRRPDFVFSYMVINLVTFLLCFANQRSNIQLGFALGLFAVFGILRYRTESIPIRDLTYLFAVIGIAIFNGMPPASEPLSQLLLITAIVVVAVAVLELTGWAGREHRMLVYDNVALLQPGREAELFKDLTARTGLQVVSVKVERLDMLRESAEVVVYYKR
jgi:hypothetical protein